MKVISENAEHLDITLFGSLRPFHNLLSLKRVPCKNYKLRQEDLYYDEFYTLHDLKITDKKIQNFIKEDIVVEVFSGGPIVLKISGGTFLGTAGKFVEELKAMPSVFV